MRDSQTHLIIAFTAALAIGRATSRGVAWMEYLAHPHRRVAMEAEHLREGGVVACNVTKVTIEIPHPSCIWATAREKGSTRWAANSLLNVVLVEKQ